MPCCKSTSSQITASCIFLCIALSAFVITVITLLFLLAVTFFNDDIRGCTSIYFGLESKVTDVPLNASLFKHDPNTIYLLDLKLAYARHDRVFKTWDLSVQYHYQYILDSDIPGAMWFCVASNVPSTSCLPASWVDDVAFGISLWDSSSNIFYYCIFDFWKKPPTVEHIVYDSTTKLVDLWANHNNCKLKAIAMLLSDCFCGVLLIPTFVGCVCLFCCIRKYRKKKKKEQLLRAYPS